MSDDFSLEDLMRWTGELEAEHRNYESQRKAIEGRPYISDEEKQDLLKAHDAKFEEGFSGRKGGILQSADSALSYVRDEEKRLRREAEFKPRTDADIARYNARHDFTRDELTKIAKGSPKEAVDVLKRAIADGDEVRVALIAKHAPEILKTVDATGETARDFNRALTDAVQARVDPKKVESLKWTANTVGGLKQRVMNVRSRKEIAELKDRFPSLKT